MVDTSNPSVPGMAIEWMVSDQWMVIPQVVSELWGPNGLAKVRPQAVQRTRAKTQFVDKYISGWWVGTFYCIVSHILGIIIIPIHFHIFQRGSNHQPDI